jgi:6-phosphogluconolactonase
MGADMHTASLFPGAPELEALAEDAPDLVGIHPPGQPGAPDALDPGAARRI